MQKLLEIQRDSDLREHITYSNYAIPLSICVDYFDDYYKQHWDCHWHDELEFVQVVTGEVIYSIYTGDEEPMNFHLTAGQGIYVASGTMHSVQAVVPGSSVDCIVFPPSFFESDIFGNIYDKAILPLMRRNISVFVFNSKESCEHDILQTIHQMCQNDCDGTYIELYQIEMVCRLVRLMSQYFNSVFGKTEFVHDELKKQRLKDTLSYIHAHFNQDLKVEDLAKSVGISRTECFRDFQLYLNQTPIQYLTAYRLKMARYLLINSDNQITEIALQCGFNSTSYFSKLFKTEVGQTPKQFRKDYQNKKS